MCGVEGAGRAPGACPVARVDDDDALPVVRVAGLDEEDLGTVLLVVKVIGDADLGGAALAVGVVDGEGGALGVAGDAGVPAPAPDVGVLALRGGYGLVGCVVRVGAGGGAAEGPGGIGGDLVEGLGEEEDAGVCEMLVGGMVGEVGLTVRSCMPDQRLRRSGSRSFGRR